MERSRGIWTAVTPLCVAIQVILVALLATGCTKQYTNIPLSQLRQMPSFKAKVDNITAEDFRKSMPGADLVAIAWLKTEKGKRVAIGGSRASPEMLGFVKSLNQGQSYTFPNALLEYEQQTGQKVQ
jgi:hypothetical protein